MDYSRSETDSMRHDAIRRTHEMYRHSQKKNEHAQAEASKIQETDKSGCSIPPNPSKEQNNPINNLFSGLFSGNKIDNDKLIIIILIIILAKNGADLKILIALGYILI